MKKLHEYETPLTDGAERECVLDSQLLDFARDLERKLALCRDALREAISERNDAAQRADALLLATGRAEL